MATGRCLVCGEAVLAVSFGGELSNGGVRLVCVGCGEVHFRFVGGLGALGSAVRPILYGTPFSLTRGLYGGAAPGPLRPLLALMHRLGLSPPRRPKDPPEKTAGGVLAFPRRGEE